MCQGIGKLREKEKDGGMACRWSRQKTYIYPLSSLSYMGQESRYSPTGCLWLTVSHEGAVSPGLQSHLKVHLDVDLLPSSFMWLLAGLSLLRVLGLRTLVPHSLFLAT